MEKTSLFKLSRWLRRGDPPLAAPAAAGASDHDSYAGLVAARDEALAKLKSRTALLANISHELRTQLSAMLGMAELLAGSALDDEQRRYLEILTTNGSSLLNLVNDILDFARAESGHLALASGEFGLVELIEGVAETLAPQAHRKGIELSTRIAEDVPAVAVGDSGRIRQILMNLASNAIKFTAAGEVTIVAEREPDTPGIVHLSVIDTGVGIDPSDHARIFASYAQAAGPRAEPGGSGLGLAIVKELAELMGGRVWLESTVGAGSSFHCIVRMGYRPRASLSDDHRGVQILAGRRLLVVIGHRYSRSAVAAALIAEGADLRFATSPDEAASIVSGAPEWPEAVVADWPVSVNDYVPVLGSLKAALPPIPLVAMLPVTELGGRLADLRSAGIDHYVIKPPRRHELIARVLAALKPENQSPASAGRTCNRAETGTPPAIAGLRILLADDAEDNRILMEAFLRHSGCQLDLVSNGAEATQHFKTGRYDVILMDLHMPEMNGYEAIRQMREWERANELKRTPIIALTAAVFEDSAKESLEAGCDSQLSKPVKRSALFNALDEVASMRAERGNEAHEG